MSGIDCMDLFKTQLGRPGHQTPGNLIETIVEILEIITNVTVIVVTNFVLGNTH